MSSLPMASDKKIMRIFRKDFIEKSLAVDKRTESMVNTPNMNKLILAVEMHDYLRHYSPLKELATRWQKTPEYREDVKEYLEKQYRGELNNIIKRKTLITIAHKSSAVKHKSYDNLERFLKDRYAGKYRKKTVWHEAVWDNIDEVMLPKSLSLIVREAKEAGYLTDEDISRIGTSTYGGG